MNFLSKIKMLFSKPKLVVLVEKADQLTKDLLFQVLKDQFNLEKDILICETSKMNLNDIKFSVKNSALPVLVLDNLSEFSLKEAKDLIALMPDKGFSLLNLENELVRVLESEVTGKHITFGFGGRADLKITDEKVDEAINFKVNYKGNTVPFWLEGKWKREEIPTALMVTGIAIVSGMNLVEISQSLRNYKTI